MAIYIGDATHPHTDVTACECECVCVYLCAAYTYDDNVLKCLSMGADLWGDLTTDAHNYSINIQISFVLKMQIYNIKMG